MSVKKIGANATFNLNTGTNTGSGLAWTPMIAARDIKAIRSPGAVFDASDRGLSINTSIPTRFKPSIEFDMIANAGAAFTALRTAFTTLAPIYAAYLDGPPGASALGMRGDWAVASFPLESPLEDGTKVKIKLQPHGNYVNAFELHYTDATNSAGTPETPVAKKLGTNASINDSTHAPITACMDIKINLEPGAMFDASDRATQTGGYFIDMVIPTRFKISVETNLIWSTAAQVIAFRTAFLAGTPLQLWVLDGPYVTSGSWGLTGDFNVTDFPMDSPLEDGQKIALKLEPAGNYTNAPGFVTI